MTPGRFHSGLGFALFGLLLAACSSIGPGSVQRDRVDYAKAFSESWKDQLLLNIVRVRYGDTPSFMDVSSVIGAYSIGVNLSAGAATNFGAPNPTTGSVGAAGAYLDRPTISYTPLSGDKFARSLLRPIPPGTIFSLIESGYPVELVIPLTVRALNGVYGRSIQGGVRRPADPDFYPLVEALTRIQLSRSLSMRLEKRGDEETPIAVFAVPRLSPEVQRDIEFVQRTLNLSPKDGGVILTYGALQRSGSELAVLSRSMLQIISYLAADIEAPPEDVADGRTFANAETGSDPHPLDIPQVFIHSGAIPPRDAFAAVSYRDSWYWIDDRDFTSKRGLTFLLLFFALAETGVAPQAPVLTIPVQ